MELPLCKKCNHYAHFQANPNNFFCHEHSKQLSDINLLQNLERIRLPVDQKSKEIITKWLLIAISLISRLLTISDQLDEDSNREDISIIEKCIGKLRILVEKCLQTDFVEAKAFYLPLDYFLIRPPADAYRFTENIIMPDLSEDINSQAEMWLKFTDYLFSCNYFKIVNSDITWTYYQLNFQRLNDLLWVGLYQVIEYLLIYQYELAEECMECCKEIQKEISPHQVDEHIIEAFLLIIKHDKANKETQFSIELQEIEDKIIAASRMVKLKTFYHIFMYTCFYLNDFQSSKKYAKQLQKRFHSIEANFVLSKIYILSVELPKSIKYLKKANLLVKKYISKNFLVKAIIFQELSKIHIFQGDKEKAAKYIRIAISFLKESKANNQLVAFQKQYYLAKILELESNSHAALKLYKKLFQICRKSNTWISADFIKCSHDYVWLLYSMNRVSDARTVILNNINTWIDKLLPWNHPILFWMHWLSAIIAYHSKLWDECRVCLEKADRIIMLKHCQKIKTLHSIIDEYLGFLCIKTKKWDQAEQHLTRCERHYEETGYYPIVDLIWIYVSLGRIYNKKQNFSKSSEYWLKALNFAGINENLKNTIAEMILFQMSPASYKISYN